MVDSTKSDSSMVLSEYCELGNFVWFHIFYTTFSCTAYLVEQGRAAAMLSERRVRRWVKHVCKYTEVLD